MRREAAGTTAQRLAAIIGCGRAGARLARRLAREGVRTRRDLRRPAVLARLPRRARARVLYAPAPVPLAAARRLAAELARRLRAPGARLRVVLAGSARRGAPLSKDIDLLVVARGGSPPAAGVLAAAGLRPPRAGERARIIETYASGPRHRALVVRAGRRHVRVDLWLAAPREEPWALFQLTGPASYCVRVREFAKRRGWRLNGYGLFDRASGRPVRGAGAVRTERELTRFMGLRYRQPADRR